MALRSCMIFCSFLLMLILCAPQIHGEISEEVLEKIKLLNKRGDFYALVVPGESELQVVLAPPFQQDEDMPVIDISGRRFHIGSIAGRIAIVAMLGNGMLNAAQTTQMLLNSFRVRAVIHYGKASNANPEQVNIGDVVIPDKFAHCGVWHWEKCGGNAEGDNCDIAKLRFSDYNVEDRGTQNRLESVSMRAEVYYSKPKAGKRTFFLRVNDGLYALAQKMAKEVDIDNCVKGSRICLGKQPNVKGGVGIGCSADISVNNVAYRDFLHRNLNAATIDTESAAVAWVCLSEQKPFITMRSITDFAGGSPPGENDLTVIQSLWPHHAREVLRAYFKLLPMEDSNFRPVTFSKV
uniref:Nucleoside phosphorylase domain-containing protein n=1 Tax=Araucaria cunninghamii TaxID=56994 RepID=A0A0D6QT40_ARACU